MDYDDRQEQIFLRGVISKPLFPFILVFSYSAVQILKSIKKSTGIKSGLSELQEDTLTIAPPLWPLELI